MTEDDRRSIKRLPAALTAGLGAMLLAACVAGAGSSTGQAQGASGSAGRFDQAPSVRAPSCVEPTKEPEDLRPTTLGTIEQAYRCLFEHYYGGAKLDDRTLLNAAFSGLVHELDRRGRTVPDAMAPPLTGNREADWAAFAAVYRRIDDAVHGEAALRQALAEAALRGMVGALHDNHAKWQRVLMPPGAAPDKQYGLGFVTTPFAGLVRSAPWQAVPPLYVTSISGGPAAQAGLRPGDVIEAVNGAPPFAGGVLSTGAVDALFSDAPGETPVRLTMRRPSTGRTWTVTLKSASFPENPDSTRAVTSRLVDKHVAYVRLLGFRDGAADETFAAIARMRESGKLRGVVVDLRGNRGGSPDEVTRLLGGWVHGKVTAYQCDVNGACETNPTDDGVALVNLPLTVLTDGDCASACDHFTSAVKDLRAGVLVGTRTAGVVSGPARPYLLDDNSALFLPERHHLGPRREVVDGSGTAPDHYVRLTAEDVSAGRDPVLAEALRLLP
ncbi:S41 family peptidase [Microbispora sp. NPDC049125]|uniref:S41 family peptidase n=1 Tax=Microbispora sp. NPDC049125 TaxID=3154929 RepID=UPI0034678BAF